MTNTKIISSFWIFITKRKIIPVGLFFLILMITGLCVFQDYGMTWDENQNQNYGKEVYEYILVGKSSDEVTGYFALTHGPVIQFGFYLLEKIFQLEDTRNIFFMRHLCTFIIFGIGVFFFYQLCKTLFRDWRISLLGCIFFVLSPRIFAHAFFNSVDITTLSLFIISIYTLIRFFHQASLSNAIFHGISCAILIDTRIVGILVPFLTALLFLMELFISNKKAKLKIPLGIYAITLFGFIVLFWPALWANPIEKFYLAYKSVSNISWGATVLYFGQDVKANVLPWHYTPVWMIITTPILYNLFFVFGMFTIFHKLLSKPKYILSNKDYIFDVIILIWLFLPIVVTIIHHSVLFDSWRHHFFVYPAFLIISLKGVIYVYGLIKKISNAILIKIARFTLTGMVISGLITITCLMVSYHPYQNVYFNMLIDKKNVRRNFELDYWGSSFCEGAEYVLSHDSTPHLNFFLSGMPMYNLERILTPSQRKRIRYVNTAEEADYFFGNYRWHKEDYEYTNEFYSVKANGLTILSVYKLR
ncbi:MAG: hypothetical protein FVQ77_15185 [Cytophagales bacterium]|nr:hypothetical protein [Cytophagales bacterium]